MQNYWHNNKVYLFGITNDFKMSGFMPILQKLPT